MQKYLNKRKFICDINGFYRRIKLKAYFKDQTSKPKTEKYIFRKPADKRWILKKTRHNIETFIEATNKEINKEIKHKTSKIFKPFKKRTRSSRRFTGKS